MPENQPAETPFTKPQDIAFDSPGAQLSGLLYQPEVPPRATLLIHGATGVPQRFYRHIAAWAASQGLAVMTYDYRDFGASRTGPVKHSRATFADWAVHDQTAAEAELARQAPTGPLWVLGHSLGGLGLPFHRHNARIERVITIGAGMTHHSDHPWSYRPKALAFWFLIGPLATWLAGYMPGERLRFGEDLPAGVYWQWRRWCIRRDFFASDVGRSLPQPDMAPHIPDLRLTTLTDDLLVPPAAVRRYADALSGAGPAYVELSPAAFGLKSLGHITCLAAGREAAWPAILGLDTDTQGRTETAA